MTGPSLGNKCPTRKEGGGSSAALGSTKHIDHTRCDPSQRVGPHDGSMRACRTGWNQGTSMRRTSTEDHIPKGHDCVERRGGRIVKGTQLEGRAIGRAIHLRPRSAHDSATIQPIRCMQCNSHTSRCCSNASIRTGGIRPHNVHVLSILNSFLGNRPLPWQLPRHVSHDTHGRPSLLSPTTQLFIFRFVPIEIFHHNLAWIWHSSTGTNRTYVALHPPHKSHPACQTHPISCTTPADTPRPERRHTRTKWRGKVRCTSQKHLHPVGSGHTSSRTWEGADTPSSTPSTTHRGTRVCRERSKHRSKRGKKMDATCARVSLPSLTRRRCVCVRNCVMGRCRVGTGARKDTD